MAAGRCVAPLAARALSLSPACRFDASRVHGAVFPAKDYGKQREHRDILTYTRRRPVFLSSPSPGPPKNRFGSIPIDIPSIFDFFIDLFLSLPLLTVWRRFSNFPASLGAFLSQDRQKSKNSPHVKLLDRFLFTMQQKILKLIHFRKSYNRK